MPLDPLNQHFKNFGFMWRAFMMMWMLLPKKYLSVSHRNNYYSLSNLRLTESLIDIECQTCGILEGVFHPQEVEAIYPDTFA